MITNEPDDISYIIAAEFELTKGTVVSGTYPKTFDLSLENILIEKLIPDGLHNYQSDCFCFRNMVPINATRLAERIQKLNKAQLTFQVAYFNDQNRQFDLELESPQNDFFDLFPDCETTSFECQVEVDSDFALVLKPSPVGVPHKLSLVPQLEVSLSFDSKVLLSSQSHNLVFSASQGTSQEGCVWLFRELLLFADPTSKKILKALSEERRTEERLYIDMHFFTVVSNKKEKTVQRGAVYRSITICTETLRDLSPFRKFVEQIIQDYMQLPPNDPRILSILQKAYETRPRLPPSRRMPRLHSHYDLSFLKSILTREPGLRQHAHS